MCIRDRYNSTQHGSRNTPGPRQDQDTRSHSKKRIVPESMAVQNHGGVSRISCVQSSNRAQRTLVFVNSKFKKQHCGAPTRVMSHSKSKRNRIMVASVNQAYLPYVVVDFGILFMSELLDSGATRSIINYDTFLKLRAHGLC